MGSLWGGMRSHHRWLWERAAAVRRGNRITCVDVYVWPSVIFSIPLLLNFPRVAMSLSTYELTRQGETLERPMSFFMPVLNLANSGGDSRRSLLNLGASVDPPLPLGLYARKP